MGRISGDLYGYFYLFLHNIIALNKRISRLITKYLYKIFITIFIAVHIMYHLRYLQNNGFFKQFAIIIKVDKKLKIVDNSKEKQE